MAIAIREIEAGDDQALAGVIRQVLTEFGANRPGFAWQDPQLDAMSRTYAPAHSVYYVVLNDGLVVGGAGIAPFACERAQVCELQKMYMLADVRGRGVGRRLLDTLLKDALARGYAACYIETLQSMDNAIALYESAGFKRLPKALGQSGHSACNRWYLRALHGD